MSRKSRLLAFVALGVGLASAAASPAQPYYSLGSGSGQQFAIGPRQWPVQPATTGGAAMSPVGTGAMLPPLLIPRNPAKAVVRQTNGPDPKQITIPPGALRRPAPGPTKHGVARYERAFQVRTNAEFSGPGPGFGSAVLRAGGRTGAAVATFTGGSVPGKVRYTKTAAQFGGPALTGVLAASPTRVWGKSPTVVLPCKHTRFGGPDPDCVAVIVESHPNAFVAAGAAVGFAATTPGRLAKPPLAVLSVPNTTGLVATSASAHCTGCVTNRGVTAGFPWTTGRISVSQSSAAGGNSVFTITGMDSRVGGIGAITLVSGALSDRALSGPSRTAAGCASRWFPSPARRSARQPRSPR